jgi:anaerobic magnesium-protoporphyrin IX monomethyl ester cyclase
MKIVLADPPAPSWNTYMGQYPNLGLLYLAAHLRQNIPDIKILYLDANNSVEQHLKFIASEKPAIYGLSFASPLYAAVKPLIRSVRQLLPETLIVCGGPHPTADPQGCLNDSPIDFCCIGEGEETFTELVKIFLSGGDLTIVGGLAHKRNGNGITFSRHRSFIRDLDSIPLPAWDLVDLRRFSGLRQARSGPSTAMTASRGCAFNCSFCSNPIWKNATPWVRRRSPEMIAREAELLYQRGIREIYIRSDLMNDKLDWTINVFDALHGLNHPDLYFQCNLRLARITPELAKAMRRAGCWSCNVGLESGSQRVLDGIKKKTKISEVESNLRTLREHDIKVFAFMMLYQVWESEGALQIETTQEVFESIRLVLSLRRKNLLNQMSWAYATPYPGSDLYRVCKKFGLLPKNLHEALISSDRMTIPIPGVSKREVATTRLAGLLVQALLNLSNRERYQPRVLIPNIKHSFMKLHHLLMDFGGFTGILARVQNRDSEFVDHVPAPQERDSECADKAKHLDSELLTILPSNDTP